MKKKRLFLIPLCLLLLAAAWFLPVSYTHLDVYKRQVYLNLLGSPSDRVLCGAIFLAALAVIAGIGGAALYAQTPGGSGKRVAFTRSPPRPRHTCLAGHELYKAMISRCGLWVLLAFFAVIALLYGRFSPERSEFEVYYRNYSEIL